MADNFEVTITLRGNDQASRAFQALNNEINRSGRESRDATPHADNFATKLGRLNTFVTGAVTAFAGLQLVNKATEFVNLGRDVNKAENTFRELAGGAYEARNALDLMRQQTRGAVTDVDLMRGASRLLLMGLADTNEKAAELAGMAVSLGGAMGQGPQESFESFAALLANRSIPRLDNFGISSAAVRARIEELKESGVGMEEAFNIAVIEQGRIAMNRLGDSLDANVTAIDRMEVRWQNFVNTFASGAAEVVDSAVTTGEQIGFIIAYNTGQTEQQTAAVQRNVDLARDLKTQFEQVNGTGLFGQTARSEEDYAFMLAQIERLRNELNRMPTMDEVLGDFQVQQRFMSEGGMDPVMQQIAEFELQQYDALIGSRDAAEEMLDIENRRAQTAREIAEATGGERLDNEQQALEYAEQLNDLETQRAQMAHRLAVEAGRQREEAERQYAINERNLMLQQAQNYQQERIGRQRDDLLAQMAAPIAGVPTDAFGNFALPEYMSQSQANTAIAMYQEQQARLDELKRLAETMPDVVSDEDVSRGEELVRQYESLARDAQTAADALERASLADLFGQTGGGRVGEMSDAVIAAMREGGATDEQIAAAQRTFDISSGRATEASLAFSEQLVPILADMDPAQAALAMQNFNMVMTTLAAANIDPNAVINAQNVAAAAGVTNGQVATNFDASAFIAGQMPMAGGGEHGRGPGTQSALGDTSQLALDISVVAEQAGIAADATHLGAWSGQVEQTNTQLDAVLAAIQTITTGRHVITFDVELNQTSRDKLSEWVFSILRSAGVNMASNRR